MYSKWDLKLNRSAREEDRKRTNFQIAAAKLIVTAKAGEEAGVPLSTGCRLANDAPVRHRQPIGSPWRRVRFHKRSRGRNWRSRFGKLLVGDSRGSGEERASLFFMVRHCHWIWGLRSRSLRDSKRERWDFYGEKEWSLRGEGNAWRWSERSGSS